MKLLSVIILSDGYINFGSAGQPHSLRLKTTKNSEKQHEMFSILSERVFHKKPAVYHRSGCLVSELFSVGAINELLMLSPTFKTTPARNQSDFAFLAQEQPMLQFLFSEPERVKWAALRIYFDFDGSVSPAFKLKKKRDMKNGKCYTYYQVQFECEIRISETNPTLVADLLKICDDLGMKARVNKDSRNWSRLYGITISRLESVKKFLRFGPITDVEISLKSRNLAGVHKATVVKVVSALLSEDGVPLSRYFKYREEAVRYKDSLSHMLLRLLKAPSSSGQR